MPLSGVLTLILLVTVPEPMSMQEASISGTVADRSGIAIADAGIELSAGGLARTTTSGPDGRFRVVRIEPGRYKLTVTRRGFRPVERNGLVVGLGDVVTIPLILEVEGGDARVDVPARRLAVPSSVTATDEDLRSRPASRDPAGLVASVPGAVVDRVDVGGSESLTALQFIYRGGRGVDTAWTIDGIVVTDRQTGRAPGYYDVESFAEVQLAPASHDITRPGSGLGVNMVVRSGSNELRGSARGFFMNGSLQSDPGNPPRDHTRQVHEVGTELGGPLYRGRAWFMAAASARETRLFRLAGGDERAEAAPRSIKVNWQVTAADRLNLLWLDHDERRYGINPSGFRAAADALQDQLPLYPDSPFRGLWKIENARALGPVSLSARYAYYGTGFQSLSRGAGPAGSSPASGETFGATSSSRSTRPQHTLAVDASVYRTMARLGHELRFGGGWQRVEMHNTSTWPGDGIVAFENSAADRRARIYRDTAAHSRLRFAHAYLSDTLTTDRWTIDVGVRLDHQRGETLPSRLEANVAFPDIMPAVAFSSATTQTWTDLSPRASARYAITPGGALALRASVGRFASQQVMAAVVQTNPANVSAWIEYPWEDLDGDRFAQPYEVRVDLPFLAFDGFNPLDPSSTRASTSLDPAMTSRMTTTGSAGIEAAVADRWTASLSYHYARHTDWPALRWDGLTSADYFLLPPLEATLPDGRVVKIPIYAPDSDLILANGSRRTFITDPDYYSTYRGIEGAVVKRMSQGWALAVAAGWSDSRGFYTASPATNGFGNPTRLDGSSGGQLTGPKDPLVQGGQLAPATLPIAGGGRIFMNARWQVSGSGSVRLPWGLDAAATVLGRDGNPSPFVMMQSLGLDGNRTILVTPAIDTVRLDDVWNLDARVSRTVRMAKVRAQLFADLFNVLDTDTALVKDRNLRSRNFGRVHMRVSPRILRLGLRLSF